MMKTGGLIKAGDEFEERQMGKVENLATMTKPLEVERSQVDSCSTKVGKLSAALECVMPHKTSALGIEYFHNDEDVDFHISSKREMLSILQGIIAQGARVALFYGDDQDFIPTTLLGANEHGMWLDVGPFPPENKQLLRNDKITFVSVHQNVKIQFVAHRIENDLFENNEAFHMDLPDYLLRIQRREFFRTAIPASSLAKCIIPIQPENPNNPVIMRTAPLMDISGGGIQLLCDKHEATLLPNKTFSNCQISLPDIGTMTVTIEVRNSINFTAPNNVAHRRVGCRFIHLDNQINILLQRHITHLQSQNMARGRLAVHC
jgi:c-di-GMP-binding flagellar brake protein YcgR